MGDAADDVFDAIERRAARADAARDWIIENCPEWNCSARMFRNDEGFLECRQCGETFDE
jgi:hypothetical protein